MPANERQHGGDHYKSEYQHWDWAWDLRLNGLAWNASRYAMRWRKKNGREDLQKAIHFCEKAQEKGATGSTVHKREELTWKFILANNLPTVDAAALFMISTGNWQGAKDTLETLLEGLPETA